MKNFNNNQLKAINHYKGNCCVMASAGSGKSAIIVYRIVNLITEHKVSPDNILAITFSKKAAINLQDRLKTLLPKVYKDISISTFHALGYKILSNVNSNINLIKDWDKKKILTNIIIKELGLENKETDVQYDKILDYISCQKNNLINIEDNPIELKNMPYVLKIMQQIYQKYEKHKHFENKIDFDDMIIKSYNLLRTNNKIKKMYQDKFKFILADEQQDTNFGQFEILKILNAPNNNLFVTGDILQCIYNWRNADNKYLMDFYKEYEDTKIINLNINYRSTDDIVKISNNLMINTPETSHKYYVESQSNKEKHMPPVFSCYINEFVEASNITKKIIELHEENVMYKDIAILTRTNYQIQAFEDALFKNNIPYNTDGNSFYEFKEIQDMINYLLLVNDTNNDEAFTKIYNRPNRYLGNVFFEEVSTYAERKNISYFKSMNSFSRCNEWRYIKGINEINHIITIIKNKISCKDEYTVGELIMIIRKQLGYDKFISTDSIENKDNNKNEKIENLDTLVEMASKFNSIDKFIEEVNERIGFSKDTKEKDKVNIMTIFKSKGLEWSIVFVVGVNNGILPHKRSNNIREELRILYVGLTRAENELYVSSTEFYNKTKMEVSPFIHKIFDNVNA